MVRERKGWYGLALIVAVGLTAWYVYNRDLWGLYTDHQKYDAQIRAVREQNKELETEIDASRRRIGQLGDDPIEIEAAIRQTKDLVREGERVYRIEVVPPAQQAP